MKNPFENFFKGFKTPEELEKKNPPRWSGRGSSVARRNNAKYAETERVKNLEKMNPDDNQVSETTFRIKGSTKEMGSTKPELTPADQAKAEEIAESMRTPQSNSPENPGQKV